MHQIPLFEFFPLILQFFSLVWQFSSLIWHLCPLIPHLYPLILHFFTYTLSHFQFRYIHILSAIYPLLPLNSHFFAFHHFQLFSAIFTSFPIFFHFLRSFHIFSPSYYVHRVSHQRKPTLRYQTCPPLAQKKKHLLSIYPSIYLLSITRCYNCKQHGQHRHQSIEHHKRGTRSNAFRHTHTPNYTETPDPKPHFNTFPNHYTFSSDLNARCRQHPLQFNLCNFNQTKPNQPNLT